jgi:hypothetical protein
VRTVFRPGRNELEQNLGGDFETGVSGQESLEHVHFFVGHEFDAIIDVGKAPEDVYESIPWNNRISCMVQLRLWVVIEDVV